MHAVAASFEQVFSDRKGPATGAFGLENPGPGAAQQEPWREHAIGGGREVMFLQLADLDQDGYEDVLVAVKPREIQWLRRFDRTGRTWQPHAIPLPDTAGTAKAVNTADFDGDGKLDLVFSCEQAKSPLHGLMWLSCPGRFTAGKWTAHELSGRDGIKHDLAGILGHAEIGVGPCRMAATKMTTAAKYTLRPRKRTDGGGTRLRHPSRTSIE